jgi:hypothetical protein
MLLANFSGIQIASNFYPSSQEANQMPLAAPRLDRNKEHEEKWHGPVYFLVFNFSVA